MKNFLNSKLFVFIISGIIFSSITSFAYLYNAKDISYTPSNSSWKINNIKSTNDTTISNLQSELVTKTATIESLNSR